jgi:hypothetical protein
MTTSTQWGSPPQRPGPAKSVERVFSDVNRLNEALRRLTQRSVPVDEIYVYLLGDDGRPERELSIESQSGALGGASIGAVGGGAIGVILLSLARAGLFGALDHAVFGLNSDVGGVRLVAVLAFVGVPIGAVAGIRSWNAYKKVSKRKFSGRSFLLLVETKELADVVRQTLDEVGGNRTSQR